MTKIDELMALADEYADALADQHTGRIGVFGVYEAGQKLRTALEAALKPGLDRDTLTVNLMRVAGLDKHKARECADVVGLMLAAPPAQTPVPPPRLTDAQMNSAVKSETGYWMCPTGDDLKFARAIETAVRRQFGVNDE